MVSSQGSIQTHRNIKHSNFDRNRPQVVVIIINITTHPFQQFTTIVTDAHVIIIITTASTGIAVATPRPPTIISISIIVSFIILTMCHISFHNFLPLPRNGCIKRANLVGSFPLPVNLHSTSPSYRLLQLLHQRHARPKCNNRTLGRKKVSIPMVGFVTVVHPRLVHHRRCMSDHPSIPTDHGAVCELNRNSLVRQTFLPGPHSQRPLPIHIRENKVPIFGTTRNIFSPNGESHGRIIRIIVRRVRQINTDVQRMANITKRRLITRHPTRRRGNTPITLSILNDPQDPRNNS